jgi:hypothetical protein
MALSDGVRRVCLPDAYASDGNPAHQDALARRLSVRYQGERGRDYGRSGYLPQAKEMVDDANLIALTARNSSC